VLNSRPPSWVSLSNKQQSSGCFLKALTSAAVQYEGLDKSCPVRWSFFFLGDWLGDWLGDLSLFLYILGVATHSDISYSHNSGCKRFAASKLHWWGAYGLRDGSVVEKAAAVLATISQYQYTLDPCASGDTNDNSYWIVRFGVSAGLEHRLVYNLVQPGTTWPAKSRRCTVTQLRLQGDSTDIAARSESRQTGAKLPWSPSSIMQHVGAGRQAGRQAGRCFLFWIGAIVRTTDCFFQQILTQWAYFRLTTRDLNLVLYILGVATACATTIEYQ